MNQVFSCLLRGTVFGVISGGIVTSGKIIIAGSQRDIHSAMNASNTANYASTKMNFIPLFLLAITTSVAIEIFRDYVTEIHFSDDLRPHQYSLFPTAGLVGYALTRIIFEDPDVT